jgi:hypothetical protein
MPGPLHLALYRRGLPGVHGLARDAFALMTCSRER